MTPMIDALMVPGVAMAVLSVGPALIGVGVTLVVGLAWIVRETNEELRRAAAREWEARRTRPTPPEHPALAA